MRPLSEDMRQRIIAVRASGEGTGKVCQRFRGSRKSVERFWKQHQLTGYCRPKQIGGYRRSRLRPHEPTLRRWIAKQSDLTLVELQQRCREQLGIKIGITALWHRLGLSYKKTTHAAEQERPDVKAVRILWRRSQPSWDSQRLVFVEETDLNTKMDRLYGRCPKNRRCVARVPHGHWQSSTPVTSSCSIIYRPTKSPASPR